MEFIRKKIANRSIKKKLKDAHDVLAVNLHKAKNIVIFFNLDVCEEYSEAILLIKNLKSRYKNISEVKGLAYTKQKELPQYFTENRDITIYHKKQVGYTYLPLKKESKIWDFINQERDILIDLSGNKIYPFKRISVEMNVKFKVGVYSEENEPFYDLLIKTDEGVHVLSEQAEYYLSLINKNVVEDV